MNTGKSTYYVIGDLVMSIQCSGFGVQTKTIGNYLLDLNNDFDVHSLNALNRIILSTVQFVLCHFYFIYNKRLQRPETLPLFYGAYEWVINAWWDGEGK